MRKPDIPIDDYVGKKFGRLTVLGKAGSTNKWARVRCDCGVEKNVIWWNVRTHRTQSCGCLVREFGNDRIKEPKFLYQGKSVFSWCRGDKQLYARIINAIRARGCSVEEAVKIATGGK